MHRKLLLTDNISLRQFRQQAVFGQPGNYASFARFLSFTKQSVLHTCNGRKQLEKLFDQKILTFDSTAAIFGLLCREICSLSYSSRIHAFSLFIPNHDCCFEADWQSLVWEAIKRRGCQVIGLPDYHHCPCAGTLHVLDSHNLSTKISTKM